MINRAALLSRMDEGLNPGVKLILLCAPAGFGKTTLAREWISELERDKGKYKICWLEIDEGDNHTRIFLRYLIATLRQVFVTSGNFFFEWINMPIKEVRDQILSALMNEMAAIDQPLLLFLDDYHFIESDDIHHCLDFLLDHLPPHVRIVMMTRSIPRIPLGRMRASGQMIEILSSDLRFNTEEIEILFNHVMRYQLNAKQIAAVEQRTEGWITALQLLALSLQGKDDQAKMIEAFTGSNRYILDYLLEETLGQLPEDIQDFLMITSILSRLRAELCDGLTGRNNSRMILEHLEKDNLFLVPLDDERIWFRYHLLFSEFLQNRLRNRCQEGRLEREQVYHRRAADWLYEHHYHTEAVEHAFLADDKIWAADIIEESTRTMYLPGEYGLLLKWLERLPKSYLLSRPRLCMAYSWALLMTGRFMDAQPLISHITESTDGVDDEIVGEAATLRSLFNSYRMEIPIAIASAQEALVKLPEDNLFLRSLAYHNLGVAYEFLDDQELALQAYDHSWQLAKRIDNVILKILSGTQLGDIRLLQGRLDEAEDYYFLVINALSETEKNLPLAGMVNLGFTRLYYEWNRLAETEKYLEKSLDLSGKWESVEFLLIARLYLIKVAYIRRDIEQVKTLLNQIDDYTHDPVLSPMIIDYVMKLLVQYWIGIGDIDNAVMHMHMIEGIEKRPPYIIHIDDMAQARIFIATGEYERAATLLEDAIRTVEQTTKLTILIGMMVLDALAWKSLGHIERASEILAKAIGLAESGSIRRTFLDEGRPILDLMLDMRKGGMLSPYGEELAGLLEIECEAVESAASKSRITFPDLFEPLTEREWEVLQLLSQGYSNKQIADRLFVAVTTVKTHIGNIYAKLRVTSRVQAAARARQWQR